MASLNLSSSQVKELETLYGDDDSSEEDDSAEGDASFSNDTTKPESSEGDKSKLGSDDSRRIRGMRFLALLVLLFSVAGALAVYLYLSSSQMEQFETQFQDDAIKLLASLGGTLDYSMGAVDALTVGLVSYAQATNQKWPFVTIPDFAVRAAKVNRLARSHFLTFYTHVEEDERNEWETYTSYNSGWVEEGIAVQAADSGSTVPIAPNITYWDVIHSYDEWNGEEGITTKEGPYMVLWQCTPVISYLPVYNWDLLSSPTSASVNATMDEHRTTVSDAYMIAYPWETEKLEDSKIEADWVKDYIAPGENPFEPVSDLYYPIIEEATQKMRLFDPDENGKPYDPKDHTFLGMVGLSFYWRDLLKDILPPGSDGIVVVFENPCNPTFTYQINGPNIEYLGTTDLHQSKYDHLEVEAYMYDLRKFAIKDSGYSGIPVAEGVCPFYIRVFPSDDMKDDYVNATPIVLAVSAGSIFLIFACLFVVYDQFVEKRQKTVLDSANSSSAIVRSMFPASIHKQMMQDQSRRRQEQPVNMSQKRRLTTFLSDGDDGSAPLTAIGGREQKPIADLFPYCTVLFADISGFTAWSSTRDPSQVFTLLETIYKSYDKLASKRNVFKVETVGDCYVAVTGLPVPQEKHAVIMAKFASECLIQFRRLTRDLEVVLGPDTADLAIRIGLHSGPVTAGVLRGERSRFQLFGDTVNKASRMTSSSHTNKIQVSGVTAALLVESGKGAWVTQRADVDAVNSKGNKGIVDLDTYWLNVRVGRTYSVHSNSDSERSDADGAAAVIRKSKPSLTIQEHKKTQETGDVDDGPPSCPSQEDRRPPRVSWSEA